MDSLYIGRGNSSALSALCSFLDSFIGCWEPRFMTPSSDIYPFQSDLSKVKEYESVLSLISESE